MAENKIQVLIVAENRGDRERVSTRLKQEGYQVHEANSSGAALDVARRHAVDMVIFGTEGERGGQAEVVEAAREQNREVRIVRIEPGQPMKGNISLDAELGQLKAAQEIRGEATLFGNSLNAVFDGILLVDVATETIVLANAAAAAALGYTTQEEIQGVGLRELIPECDTEAATGICEEILKGEGIAQENLLLRRKDNELLHCRCRVMLTAEPSKKLIQIVFRDMNEQKCLIEHLAGAGQSIPLAEILSGVAHELNNPLAAILGYSQLSLTSTSRKKLDEYLQTIYEQAVRCQAIVQRLSSHARRPSPHRKVTDLDRVIEQVVSLFACELRSSNIEVRLNVSPWPVHVSVDPEQMQQVFVNLIKNASEAMAVRGRGVLSIATERRGREAVVTFSDNGPGIAENVANRVFEPFFSTKPHATGLGLSISRSIVRANEGRIDIVEERGEGATFEIRFPVANEASRQNPPADEAAEHGFCGGETILIIEDDKPIAALLGRILNRAGNKADILLSPVRAQRTIEGKEYDLILMDIEPPGGGTERAFRPSKDVGRDSPEDVVFCRGDLIDEEVCALLSLLDNSALEQRFGLSRVCAVSRRT